MSLVSSTSPSETYSSISTHFSRGAANQVRGSARYDGYTFWCPATLRINSPSLTLLPLALASSSGLPWAVPVLDGMPGILGMSSFVAAKAPTISKAVMVNGSEPFGSFQICT
ncbi:hypothetical protein D3C84_1003780 [compost metagenome]